MQLKSLLLAKYIQQINYVREAGSGNQIAKDYAFQVVRSHFFNRQIGFSYRLNTFWTKVFTVLVQRMFTETFPQYTWTS